MFAGSDTPRVQKSSCKVSQSYRIAQLKIVKKGMNLYFRNKNEVVNKLIEETLKKIMMLHRLKELLFRKLSANTL